MRWLLFSIAFLLLPVLLSKATLPQGVEAYHYVSGWQLHDSVMQRALPPQIFPVVAKVPFISVILTAISLLIFYKLLLKLSLSRQVALLAVAFAAASPALLSTAFFATPESLGLLLLIAALLLAETKHNPSAATLFAILAATEPVMLFACTIILFMRKHRGLALASAGFALLAIGWHWWAGRGFGFMLPTLGKLSTDMGSMHGYGITFIALSGIGIGFAWSNWATLWHSHLAGLLFIIFSTVHPSFSLLGSLLLAVYGSIAVSVIFTRTWLNKNLKILAFAAIISGLLLSYITFSTRLAEFPPTSQFLDSISHASGRVVTHESYGAWLEHLGKEPYVDDWSGIYFNEKHRLDEADRFFQGRSLANATGFLKQEKIDSILITREMKSGLVWSLPDQGLLFLLTNGEVFEKTYEDENVEVWGLVGS